ncbi:MAG: sigma-70 family RNA polymerase sigma factor [Negativicoccus succinicivorans]|nr:sigma-70 family RNA polymerase sigma factor [Negativicoccus succinicivorans]
MKTSYLTANDIDLVTAAQAGDTLAATVLYRRDLPLIHATARTFFTRDRDELLAVIRFAFWKAVGRYDKSRRVPVAGYLKTQLHYAAWNACAKHAHTEQRENGGDTDTLPLSAPPREQPDATYARNQLYRALHAALLTLPQRQRHVIYGLFFRQQTRGELARELHCTPQAISALKRRALDALRRKLAAYAPDKP